MSTLPQPRHPALLQVDEHNRRYNPLCFARESIITNMDLDVTKECNLRCVYCFKGELAGPKRQPMPLSVARAAVDWLIDNSADVNYLNVNFLGGEPTLAWRHTIEHLVPYGKRRGFTRGKTLQFSTTSNLTLVSEEIVRFSARWGMGWHLSIDGLPEVQLAQRLGQRTHLVKKVEDAARRILSYRGGFCARATFTPAYFDRVFESYEYLRQLGFRSFGFACSTQALSTEQCALWVAQSEQVADDVLRRAARGEFLDFGLLSYIFRTLAGGPEPGTCGAGRGYVMIDQEGNIWPCHRWDGAAQDTGQGQAWCLGNIFTGVFDHALHRRLLDRDRSVPTRCQACSARGLCGRGCPAENLSETGSCNLPRESDCQMMLMLEARMIPKYTAAMRDGNGNLLRFIDSLSERLPNSQGIRV